MKRILALLLSLLLSSSAMAGDVSLAWDASISEGVVGYKIYTGTSSGNYGEPVVVGNQTSYTVTNLTGGLYYYFAATAYDAADNESIFSNEVMTFVAVDNPLAIIGQSVGVNWYGVVLLAVTNNPASATLRYQEMGVPDAPWYTIIASPTPVGMEHRAVISGSLLKGDTYYRYQWSITDGTVNLGAGSTFHTWVP